MSKIQITNEYLRNPAIFAKAIGRPLVLDESEDKAMVVDLFGTSFVDGMSNAEESYMAGRLGTGNKLLSLCVEVPK